jgi:hypothetical protein
MRRRSSCARILFPSSTGWQTHDTNTTSNLNASLMHSATGATTCWLFLAQAPSELHLMCVDQLFITAPHRSVAIREIHADRIGHLVTLRAMITRCSDVRPLARVITYSCDHCGFETYQEVRARAVLQLVLVFFILCLSSIVSCEVQVVNDYFMPAVKCNQCEANQITSKVTMQVCATSSTFEILPANADALFTRAISNTIFRPAAQSSLSFRTSGFKKCHPKFQLVTCPA